MGACESIGGKAGVISERKNTMFYGAIEAGGTKMVCAVGTADGGIVDTMQTPTRTPEETIPVMLDYFRKYEIETLGIGTFGPVELDRDSEQYGCILNSPKTAWKGFNFYAAFHAALGCPVVIDTDVNAAVFGEYKKGALRGIDNAMYLTVGTGIGAGVIVEGRLLHGMLHPEAGHILLERHPEDTMECNCPYHKNCLEGLAAGPALGKRAGVPGAEIDKGHPVWELESCYIAQALVNYTLVLSCKRIVLGGGVMEQQHLFPMIRKHYRELMGGYVDTKELQDLEHYIVPAGLNGQQGIVGALFLGMEGL